MKIVLLFIGKNKSKLLKEELDHYQKRLRSFTSLEILEIPDVKQAKGLSASQVKSEEAAKFRDHFKSTDSIYLLDEKGDSFHSNSFAKFLAKGLESNPGRLVFCIGGAFGFEDQLKKEAKQLIALSSLTFTHQHARLLLVEQIYRAFTILNNHPYHNN